MDDGWIKIISTPELFKAKVLEAKLKENEVQCHIMNKQDSSYVMFGNIDIYIKEADAERAKAILEEIEEY